MVEDREVAIRMASKIFRELAYRPPINNEDIPMVLMIAKFLVNESQKTSVEYKPYTIGR